MLKVDAEETAWLAECYSQVLQATTLNLTTAYKNFFEKRASFPKFKSKHGKQSIQYPQNVKIDQGNVNASASLSIDPEPRLGVKLPGNIGIVKAKIHRPIKGKIKTVTVNKTPSGKYFASILTFCRSENLTTAEGKIYGIDLGLKHFAVVTDGEKVSKYDHQKHLAKHEKNLSSRFLRAQNTWLTVELLTDTLLSQLAQACYCTLLLVFSARLNPR